MAVQNIDRIDKIIISDAASPTGKRIIGFDTFYKNGSYRYSQAMFDQRILRCFDAEDREHCVELDKSIERIDIYHSQYGIALSEQRNCFFITSWGKGIYCCDLATGQIRWNCRLKHATKVFLYQDYLLCAIQEIGLRKFTYEGVELGKYPSTAYNACCMLEEPYVFIGPNRGAYCIVDTSTMSLYKKIKQVSFANRDDRFVFLGAQGNAERIQLRGFKNEEPFEGVIYP